MPYASPLPSVLFYFLTFLFLLFGSLLGSFCNVVILRMGEGRSVVFPPSACPACKHRLYPVDLIPVFGWILLRGKCRYCGNPISVQYPVVEAAIALTLASAFWWNELSPRFVPSASWGIIWLVVTVIWFRGEVKANPPFLWPLVYRIPLLIWAGRLVPADFFLPALAGSLSTAILSWRWKEFPKVPWWGLSAIGLLSTSMFGPVFPALFGIITLLQLFFPISNDSGPSTGKALFFCWNVLGMIACCWFGNWGF